MTSAVIIALDYRDYGQALDFVATLNPNDCRLKIGKGMFTRFGPDFVKTLVAMGFDVFLDLKFHDIPNTVAEAITAACDLGVWMVNVHLQGGQAMLDAARKAVDQSRSAKPLLIGVSVLTSLVDDDLKQLGYQYNTAGLVLRLAELAKQSQLDGIVCSAREIAPLRDYFTDTLQLVTPGIRLTTADDDQRRTMTPKEAITLGTDYLVIGRPITQASDPAAVLQQILTDIRTR
jgi:orotidine-5'-phosphate decarboxylase